MVVEAVGEPESDVGQDEQRRAALLVEPLDAAVAQHDLALPQQPVGEAAVGRFRLRQLDARDENAAVVVAADLEVRGVEGERVEAQLPREQRTPADGGVDRGQTQGHRARAVMKPDVRQRQIRMQAMPRGVDAADGDFFAHRSRQQRSDVVLVRVGVRQHEIPHRQDEGSHDEPYADEHPSEPAQHADREERALFGGGRGRRRVARHVRARCGHVSSRRVARRRARNRTVRKLSRGQETRIRRKRGRRRRDDRCAPRLRFYPLTAPRPLPCP